MKPFIGFLLAAGALGTGLYFARRGGGSLSGSRRHRLRGPSEQYELKVFIDNDGALYRQQTTPIHKNLITKMAKGVYDPAKAEKLWLYLVDAGAKKYARDAGSSTSWHDMFPISDRRAVAKALNDEFVTEAKLHNYDHLLPKKYRGAA